MKSMKSVGLLVTVALVVSSCQKEISFDDIDTGPTMSIIGEWTFVGMSVNSQTTVTGTTNGIPAMAVATVDYLSKNNSGTAIFTADEFSYTNITYDVDTLASMKIYVAGILIDELEQPFNFNFPPASKSVGYVLNSSDSLTFDSMPIDPNIPAIPGIPGIPQPILPAGPFGARIAWSGDTLLIKTNLTFTQTITQPTLATANISMKSTIKFLPQ